MNRKNLIAAAAVMLIILPSCFKSTSPDPEVRLRDFTRNDDEQAQQTATAFINGFSQSLLTGDFSFWQKELPFDSQNRITEREFKGMAEELKAFFGKYESYSYLGCLITGELRNYLWKLTFTREQNGKKSVYEAVYLVRVFCEENKKPAVCGFGVKRF